MHFIVGLKPSSSCIFSLATYMVCWLGGFFICVQMVCKWFDGLFTYRMLYYFGWQNIMGINTMLTYIFSYLYSGIALKFLQHYFIRYIIFLAFLSDLVMKKTILAWPVFRSFLIYDFFAVWEEALGYILLVSCSMKLILAKSGFRG